MASLAYEAALAVVCRFSEVKRLLDERAASEASRLEPVEKV
jgi:hypothetical protein